MARDADGRAKVHLQNVRQQAVRRRSGLFSKSRPLGKSVAQEGVVSVETRGRRSTSQRIRDAADQARSIGTLFEGSPKIIETIFTVGFVGLIVYLGRPHITVYGAPANSTGVFWGGKEISKVVITRPDKRSLLNLSVLIGAIAAGGQGDLGSLLAPATAAGLFNKFVDVEIENENVYSSYDLRVLTYPGQPSKVPYSSTPKQGIYDARVDFYLKAVLPRYLSTLMIALLFWFILRYIRHIGQ